MKPWLLAALAATLLATGGLALWPAESPEDLLPAARPAATVVPAPAPTNAARLQRPPASPSTPGIQAGPAAPGRDPGPDPARPLLPTRPADWPAAPAAALAAWQGPLAPPPPVPATRSAAPAAQAAGPVFPYRWIGQLDDGGAPQVLLASAQRSVAVRLGATLDGRWRLLLGPGGVLQVQALPDGIPQAVPGAPPAAQPG